MEGVPTGFWGKLETDGERVLAWHPLEDHCADVAACVEALLTQTLLGERLAKAAGGIALTRGQIARLAIIGALHDLGKFNQHFQNKGRPGALPREGHVREVAELLRVAPPHGKDRDARRKLFAALPVAEFCAWGKDPGVAWRLLLAAIAHHGRPIRPDHAGVQHDPARWKPVNDLDPFAAIEGLARQAFTWFPDARDAATTEFPVTPALQHAFAGVVMLADWLGSDRSHDRFRFSQQDDGPRIDFARDRARESLRTLHLDPGTARSSLGPAPPGFEQVFGYPKPHPAQAATANLPLPSSGSVVLLESETGSGKTEAAIARFFHLFHAGHVDGMYFALPTRTAATQLFGRVRDAVARAFPEEASRPPVILAVPGYLAADEMRGQRLAGFDVLWKDDRDTSRATRDQRHRYWAAEHPKRFLSGAVAVGTVDQVLLSALRVDHAHLRATTLTRQLLVVDEVHASDAYMTRILEAVLATHVGTGGHALLMSATLGSAARDRLFSFGRSTVTTALAQAVARGYPALSHAQGGAAPSFAAVPFSGRSKQVELTAVPVMDEPESVAALALDAALAGARVLVIRNTVRDAVDTQQALEQRAQQAGAAGVLFECEGAPAPHHARFAKPDREALDRAIEQQFGKNSPSRGCVVVATQTVQQSLDLDADLLITDLCPMDVLLQRIGRLHRHVREGERARPAAYQTARCRLLVPESRDLGGLIGRNGEPRGRHGLGNIYDDLRVLEATWCQTEANPRVSIPGMNRALVEATTHPEALAPIGERDKRWREHAEYVRGKTYGQRSVAALALLDRAMPFDECDFGDSNDERISTRLGEGDRRVEFEPAVHGAFGTSVQDLRIPAWMARGVAPDAVVEDVEHGARGFTFVLGARRYTYDRLGLRLERAGEEESDG